MAKAAAVLNTLLALISLCAGLFLSWHHPLGGTAATGLFLTGIVICWIWPRVWLIALPGLLPVLGLAPLSGWLTFEEMDLLVLAVAGAGFARRAVGRPATRAHPARSPTQSASAPLVWVMGMLLVALQLISIQRGFADAGAFTFGWYQGYREPMNSVRLGKSLFEALLMVHLWRGLTKEDPQSTVEGLSMGLCASLFTTSLAAVWERAVYTGITNFSTDYRTTALFWEMHVGGAALDGWLALTVPFALRELLTATQRLRWLFAALTMSLAAYACLTTFSRGVYLAVPVGVAVALLLHARQTEQVHQEGLRRRLTKVLPSAALLLLFTLAAATMFPTSGYRGQIALVAASMLAVVMPQRLRPVAPVAWVIGVAIALGLGVMGLGLSLMDAKAAYLFFGACSCLCVAVLAYAELRCGPHTPWLAQATLIGGFLAVVAGLGWVAHHWGDSAAMAAALPAMGGLLVVPAVALATPTTRWPAHWRWQATMTMAMALCATVVATFLGGQYMSGRFTTSNHDLEGRQLHWQRGLSMLNSPEDWLLGRGAGRFVDNMALNSPKGARPGDYRLATEDDNAYLALIAGNHVMGWGEILRISQRIDVPAPGPVEVRLMARTKGPSGLHVEICVKHLLYDAGCAAKHTKIPDTAGRWQPVAVLLPAVPQPSGAWYVPRQVTFSIATTQADGLTQVDRLQATATDGQQLLTNGDFENGMAHWFFTSDRNHMPWHMKSMVMHLVFEQGLLGAGMVLLLLLLVMLRLAFGNARRHALAPAIVAGLAGFLVVGLFDSVLDVPRLALMFYFVLLVGAFAKPHAAARAPAAEKSV